MKKLTLLFILFLSVVFHVEAQEVDVCMVNNSHFSGKFISMTDSLLTIQWNKTQGQLDLPLSKILFSEISGKYYVQQDNTLTEVTIDEYLNYIDELINNTESAKVVANSRMNNPSVEIAKAIKTSGASTIGLGIPILAVGTILTGYGYGVYSNYIGMGMYTHSKTEFNCQTAGLVMMGVGGGMTLIGIPLYCSGDKALKVTLNVQANGAGLSMNF